MFTSSLHRWFRSLGTGVLLWVLTGCILYPAFSTLRASLMDDQGFTLQRYMDFFTAPTSLDVLQNSIILGLLTVVCCGLVGTGLAFCVNYFRFPYRAVVDKLLLLPLMMPGIIIVFAFVQLYGESGLVTKTLELVLHLEHPLYSFSGLPGILFVHTCTQYVFFYITVSLAIRQIDSSLMDAARNLGASRRQVFTTVIWPAITPALITSATVTFMTGIGSFTAPSIMGGGYKVLTTQILLSKANNYIEVAATQVVILTTISLLFFIFCRWHEQRAQFSSSIKGTPFHPVPPASPVLKAALFLGTGTMLVLILLPFFTIILLSFVDSGSWMVSIYPQQFCLDNYLTIFTKTRSFAPFSNSVVMAVSAALLCVAVALPSSYIIEKTTSRFRWVIDIIVMLPWAMPASAVAFNIITATASPSVFTFNTVLVGTYILLPLGYFIRSLPIMVQTTHISFQNLHTTYLEASNSLGASAFTTTRKIAIPILYPGLLAGFLLVFVRSIGEYNVSAFLYTASNKPMSIAMVNAIFEYNIGLAMAYGSLLVALTICLSLVAGQLKR